MEMNLRDLVQAKAPTSVGVQSVVEDLAAKSASEQRDYINRAQKVYIRQVLTPEEQDKLRKRFSGFTLHLTHEFCAPHGFAAASRTLETLECLDFFPQDDLVGDFGGNWYFHFSKHKRVHSCCPTLDIRDASRQKERLLSVRRLLQFHGDRYVEKQPDFCCQKAEDCKVQFLWAISIHGGYDMGLQGLCEAMYSHGTELLKGTVIIDPLMAYTDEGFLKDLNCRWHIKRVWSEPLLGFDNSQAMIYYDFVGEPTNSYCHKWENVSSFLTDQVLRIKDKHYFFERTLSMYGIMSFKITEVCGNFPRSIVRHCVWFNELKDYVGVRIVDPRSPRKWRQVLVKRDVVREVEEIAFRCFKDNRDFVENVKTMASALSAKSSTTIINGMSIHSGERLPIDEFHLVALSLTLHAEQKIEEIKKVYSALKWRGLLAHLYESVAQPVRECCALALAHCWPSTLKYFEDNKYVEELATHVAFENEYEMSDSIHRPDYIVDASKSVDLGVKAFLIRAAAKEAQAVELRLRETIDGKECNRPIKIVENVEPLAPKLLNGYSSKDPLPAQAMEFIAYQERMHNTVVNNMKSMWSACLAGGVNKMLLKVYHDIDPLFNARIKGEWFFPKDAATEYMRGFNIELGLCDLSGDCEILVNKDTVVCVADEIANYCKSLKKKNFSSVHVDGVAGCGKTTAIKEEFNMETDVIVTANRKSAEDIRSALKLPEGIDTTLVRTADSLTAHGPRKCFGRKRVLFDEVGLVHPGQVFCSMYAFQADELRCYGDSEQISFKNRDPTFSMNWTSFIADKRVTQLRTYRCPQDVVLGLRYFENCLNKSKTSKYKTWYTSSEKTRSLQEKEITSIYEVPLDEDAHYMTWVQNDKAALVSRAKTEHKSLKFISEKEKTVHESQGVSVKKIIGVRLKSTACPLVKDPEYVRVMLTRHTDEFVYYHKDTTADDAVVKICRYAGTIPDVRPGKVCLDLSADKNGTLPR